MTDERERARSALSGAREAAKLAGAVVRFHRHVDEVLERSHRAHATALACSRGCSLCCHLQVELLPPEAFALAAWLRRSLARTALAGVMERLRANVERIRATGLAERKRSNLACALLGPDGTCIAYEARPAQCRRFHSTDLAACRASHANPADESILSPAHPLVAHNAQVIVTLAQHGLRDHDLDATPVDMNVALLAALEDTKAWRRWRDGKKPFALAGELAAART